MPEREVSSAEYSIRWWMSLTRSLTLQRDLDADFGADFAPGEDLALLPRFVGDLTEASAGAFAEELAGEEVAVN